MAENFMKEDNRKVCVGEDHEGLYIHAEKSDLPFNEPVKDFKYSNGMAKSLFREATLHIARVYVVS